MLGLQTPFPMGQEETAGQALREDFGGERGGTPGRCWWEGREFQGEEAAGAKGLGQGGGGGTGGEGEGDEVRRSWRCRAD